MGHDTFRVMPDAAPEGKPAPHDKQAFGLAGWEIVSRGSPDFDEVSAHAHTSVHAHSIMLSYSAASFHVSHASSAHHVPAHRSRAT